MTMAWNETWMLIYTLLLVIGFSFTTTLWRKEKARAEHLDRALQQMADSWMQDSKNLEADLDRCKKRMTALKEERDQLEKRCRKLEQDLKLQWVWDSKHGYWIPSNASATTLMQKVPFPIMGIAKDDKKD
jgi:cell division protein FtsB